MIFSDPTALAFLCAMQIFSSNCQINEICDIEGSGIDECPVDTYCCKQSECDKSYISNDTNDKIIDIEYDSHENLNDKCCNDLTVQESDFNQCKICTKCCDEVERHKIPLPDNCSKCRICENKNLLTTGKKIYICLKLSRGKYIVIWVSFSSS